MHTSDALEGPSCVRCQLVADHSGRLRLTPIPDGVDSYMDVVSYRWSHSGEQNRRFTSVAVVHSDISDREPERIKHLSFALHRRRTEATHCWFPTHIPYLPDRNGHAHPLTDIGCTLPPLKTMSSRKQAKLASSFHTSKEGRTYRP